MKIITSLFISTFITSIAVGQSFTMEAIKSYPFPTELVASSTGSKIAWAMDEQGKRNVYVAEGPDFKPRKVTNYTNDDGQEITSLSVSADGKWVVFVRGGDHGSNWDESAPVNPSFATEQVRVSIISVPFAGGEVKTLSDGDAPSVSPKSDAVAFISGGQVQTAPIDGSDVPKKLFTTRGSIGSLEWSGDGSQLAFVSDRGDHSIIGVFKNSATPINWIAPSFTNDFSPKWSPDGSKLVFIRMAGNGGAPDSILTRTKYPWSIWTADVASGKATELYKSPKTLRGSIPTTHGSTNLNWAAGDKIVFLSYMDGWPHLYSIDATGGKETLLTSGNFMVEHVRLTPDKKSLVFSANTGPDPLDLDRRHVGRVAVNKPGVEILTQGEGVEWTPVITGDEGSLALIGATAQRPPSVSVISISPAISLEPVTVKVFKPGLDLIPENFPKNLVTPKKVTFKASDGVTVHADLFEPANSSGKKPAILYIHGGPPRQMLLGWHYSDYYSNAYASNQYLASLGFVVLSVNYRLGIGYGYDFHNPENAGSAGASEYLDIKAAGEWLSKQANVDATKIGVYGGSYGGFLTALALGKDSKIFAAGVDIHGVHDFVVDRGSLNPRADKYEKAPDLKKAIDVAWKSSPVAYVDTWKSPVLIIHADDDRNVRFTQSSDLVRRLDKKGVPTETLVIVDDTHHWMKHSNAVKVYKATADFFVRQFLKK